MCGEIAEETQSPTWPLVLTISPKYNPNQTFYMNLVLELKKKVRKTVRI